MFFSTILFNFVTIISILFYGILFSQLTKFNSRSLFILFINGSLLIAFISLLFNFFTALNIYLTNSLFLISFFLGLVYLIKKKINFIEVLFAVIISSLFTYKSGVFDDYNLYHLPYMQILNEFKIIFGLSNLHTRFGHVSIFQNISAFYKNSLMGIDSFVIYAPLLVSITLIHAYKIFRSTSNILIITLSFILLTFFFINANRYGNLGNDYPSHGLFILLVLYILEIKNKNSFKINETFYSLCSIFLICFFAKISFVLSFIILIYIYFRNYNHIKINYRYFSFFIFSILIFFLKNIINTSCIIFPIYLTCFSSDWLPNKYSEHSALYVSSISETINKDYMSSNFYRDNEKIDKQIIDQIKKDNVTYENLNNDDQKTYKLIKRYELYNHINNWFPIYYENYFFNKILKELIPFIISILFFNIIFILYAKSNYLSFGNLKIKNEYFYFINIFNTLILIIWFFNFPLLRYGISFILIFISSISFYSLRLFNIDKEKYKKFLSILLLIFFLYAILDNVIRIISFDEKNYYHNKLVYLEKIESYKYKFDNNITINLSKSVCGYTEPLCINENEFKLVNREFLVISSKNDYILFKNKN